MPGKYLHAGCTIKCSACQAVIQAPAPLNQVFKTDNQLVLLQTDQFVSPAGAGLCLGPKTAPNPLPPCPICVAPLPLTWAAPCQVTKINNIPALLQTSQGQFNNYLGAPTPVAIQDSVPPTISQEK